MPAASFVGSDGNYGYVKLEQNSPSSSANTPELTGNIRKLETMPEVSEGDTSAVVQPTALLSHTDELKIPELADIETDPIENLQDNGATPPVGTQPYLPHSPLEDTSAALAGPPPCPHVEAIDAAHQARTGELPYVHPLGSNNMLFGVY